MLQIDRSVVLLDDMRQLAGQQFSSSMRPRSELPRTKHNVLPNRIRLCTDRLRRFRRLRILMHPDIAEIVTEAGLEIGARGGVQRMSRRTEDVAHDPGDVARGRGYRGAALDCRLRLLLQALFAYRAAVGTGAWG